MTNAERVEAIKPHIAEAEKKFQEALTAACVTGYESAVEGFFAAVKRLDDLRSVEVYAQSQLHFERRARGDAGA